MTKFYTGIRSVEVYLKEIERYYNLLKNSKDIDQYGHYLILMKNQIEFLSMYIIETDKFEHFENKIQFTGIDKDMVVTIITTVRANIKFIVKALKLTRLEEDKEKLKKWDNRFGNDSGYQGEIRLGKPGRTRVNRDGTTVHFVDESTWNNIREQLGLAEEAVKGNSMYEVIGKHRDTPLSLNPDHKANRVTGSNPRFYKNQGHINE